MARAHQTLFKGVDHTHDPEILKRCPTPDYMEAATAQQDIIAVGSSPAWESEKVSLGERNRTSCCASVCVFPLSSVTSADPSFST